MELELDPIEKEVSKPSPAITQKGSGGLQLDPVKGGEESSMIDKFMGMFKPNDKPTNSNLINLIGDDVSKAEPKQVDNSGALTKASRRMIEQAININARVVGQMGLMTNPEPAENPGLLTMVGKNINEATQRQLSIPEKFLSLRETLIRQAQSEPHKTEGENTPERKSKTIDFITKTIPDSLNRLIYQTVHQPEQLYNAYKPSVSKLIDAYTGVTKDRGKDLKEGSEEFLSTTGEVVKGIGDWFSKGIGGVEDKEKFLRFSLDQLKENYSTDPVGSAASLFTLYKTIGSIGKGAGVQKISDHSREEWLNVIDEEMKKRAPKQLKGEVGQTEDIPYAKWEDVKQKVLPEGMKNEIKALNASKELILDEKSTKGKIYDEVAKSREEAKVSEPEIVKSLPSEERFKHGALVQINSLTPAIIEGNGIIVGKEGGTHPDILKEHDMEPETVHERGFTTPEGLFLDRKEGKEWIENNQPEIHEELVKMNGKDYELHSQDYNKAKENLSEEKEAIDATEKGKVPEGNIGEYSGTDKIGETPEAGEGNRLPEGGEIIEGEGKGAEEGLKLDEGSIKEPDAKITVSESKSIEEQAKELGLTAKKWPDHDMYTIVDPENKGNFEVRVGENVKDKLEKHRSKGWDEIKPKEELKGSDRWKSPTAEFLNKQSETKMPPEEWGKRIDAWENKNPHIKDENKFNGLKSFIESKKGDKTLNKKDITEFLELSKKDWAVRDQVAGDTLNKKERARWQELAEKKELSEIEETEFDKLQEKEIEDKDRWESHNIPGGIKGSEKVYTISLNKPSRMKANERLDKFNTEAINKHGDVSKWPDDVFDEYMKLKDEFNNTEYGYQSPHFPEQTNVILHFRTQEHLDANGNKGLMIETIQSDLHQEAAGRYKGDIVFKTGKENDKWFVYDVKHKNDKVFEHNGKQLNEDTANKLIKKWNDELHLDQYYPPNAPFEKTWAEVGLKHALDIATKDPEIKWVAWPNGKVQMERWGKDITTDELGKKQGSDFLEILYDKRIPKFAKKYAKDLGGEYKDDVIKYKATELDNEIPQEYGIHRIDLTNKMRESINTEGQTLFSDPFGIHNVVNWLGSGDKAINDFVHAMEDAKIIVKTYNPKEFGDNLPDRRSVGLPSESPVTINDKDLPKWKFNLSPHTALRGAFDPKNDPVIDNLKSRMKYYASSKDAITYAKHALKDIPDPELYVKEKIQPLFDKHEGLIDKLNLVRDKLATEQRTLSKIPEHRGYERIQREVVKLTKQLRKAEKKLEDLTSPHADKKFEDLKNKTIKQYEEKIASMKNEEAKLRKEGYLKAIQKVKEKVRETEINKLNAHIKRVKKMIDGRVVKADKMYAEFKRIAHYEDIEKRIKDLEGEEKLLEPEFKLMSEEFDKLYPQMCKESSGVRVFANADGSLPEGIKLTPEELRASNMIKAYMEMTRNELEDLRIPVIKEGSYMTHLLEPLMKGDSLFKNTKIKSKPTLLRFISRMPYSRPWFPSPHAVMEAYIPMAEYRLAYQPFLDRWRPYIDSIQKPQLKEYMEKWLEANMTNQDKGTWDKILNATVAFEYARTIGLSLSVGIKHLVKLFGTPAEYGTISMVKGLPHVMVLPFQSGINLVKAHFPTFAKALKKIGVEGHDEQLRLFKLYVNSGDIIRMMTEIPGIQKMDDIWLSAETSKTIKGAAKVLEMAVRNVISQPVKTVEMFDNGASIMAGVIAGMKKGVNPIMIDRHIIESILDVNFRSGPDQALYQKNVLLRALSMFQQTPQKLVERIGKWGHDAFAVTKDENGKWQIGKKDIYGTHGFSKLFRFLIYVGIAESIARENDTSLLGIAVAHIPFTGELVEPTKEFPFYEWKKPKITTSPVFQDLYDLSKSNIMDVVMNRVTDFNVLSKMDKYNKETYPTSYDSSLKYILGLRRVGSSFDNYATELSSKKVFSQPTAESKLKSDLTKMYKRGIIESKDLTDAVKDKLITQKEKESIIEKSKENLTAIEANRMDYTELINGVKHADEEELKIIKPILLKKVTNAHANGKITGSLYKEYMEGIRELP